MPRGFLSARSDDGNDSGRLGGIPTSTDLFEASPGRPWIRFIPLHVNPELHEWFRTHHDADVLLVVGTSLQVYPAAGLVFEAPKRARRIVVNPDIPEGVTGPAFETVAKPATGGVPEVVAELVAADRSSTSKTER